MDGLQALVRNITFATLGVPATVGGVDTRIIWVTPSSEQVPGASEFQRAELRRAMAIRKDDVPLVPRGTIIHVLPPAEDPTTWRVDATISSDELHTRVIVMPATESA